VKATLDALQRLKQPQRVARLRGRPVEEILGIEPKPAKAAAAPAAPAAPAES
jgi:ribosomal protein L12E/L44/L45/RPP1/RPP2